MIMPCLGLVLLAPLECLYVITCNYLSLSPSTTPRGIIGGGAGSILLAISSPRKVAVLPLVSLVDENFPSLP